MRLLGDQRRRLSVPGCLRRRATAGPERRPCDARTTVPLGRGGVRVLEDGPVPLHGRRRHLDRPGGSTGGRLLGPRRTRQRAPVRRDASGAPERQRRRRRGLARTRGFQELPSREDWYTPRHRDEAHVRSLGAHPDAPNRVVAGVEEGGVHVSEDRGESWTERRDGVQDDVHHVLVLGPETYVASCGDGLYRTRDGGRSWTRLDDALSYRYFREATMHDGRLYCGCPLFAGNLGRRVGRGRRYVRLPGRGRVLRAGSRPRRARGGHPRLGDCGWPARRGDGRRPGALRGERRGETGGRVPAGIRSLCPA